MLALVRGLGPDDTVLCLISGGGSALLPLPLEGISLEDEQAVNRALLRWSATIGEMNCVRRHLSAIKGVRLGAACHPARVLTLLISDGPGDRPCDIASGLTVGDPSTCQDVLAIVRGYGIELPDAVRAVLESGRGESVKPGDPRLARAETRMWRPRRWRSKQPPPWPGRRTSRPHPGQCHRRRSARPGTRRPRRGIRDRRRYRRRRRTVPDDQGRPLSAAGWRTRASALSSLISLLRK